MNLCCHKMTFTDDHCFIHATSPVSHQEDVKVKGTFGSHSGRSKLYDCRSRSVLMVCPQLPGELWHEIITIYVEQLVQESLGQSRPCSRSPWTFDDKAQHYLSVHHELDMPWDLPTWQHLDRIEKAHMFDLRLVNRTFDRALLGIMLAGIMIPAGSPIASMFCELFGREKDLPIRSLECKNLVLSVIRQNLICQYGEAYCSSINFEKTVVAWLLFGDTQRLASRRSSNNCILCGSVTRCEICPSTRSKLVLLIASYWTSRALASRT